MYTHTIYALNRRGKLSRICCWFDIYDNRYMANLSRDNRRALQYAGMFMHTGVISYSPADGDDTIDPKWYVREINGDRYIEYNRGTCATLCPIYNVRLYDKFMELGDDWSQEFEEYIYRVCIKHNKTKYLSIYDRDYIRYDEEIFASEYILSDAQYRRIYKYSIIDYLYDTYTNSEVWTSWSIRDLREKLHADALGNKIFTNLEIIAMRMSNRIFRTRHIIMGIILMVSAHCVEVMRDEQLYTEALQFVYKKYKQLCIAALKPEIPYHSPKLKRKR
jgi:hypothetical protein